MKNKNNSESFLSSCIPEVFFVSYEVMDTIIKENINQKTLQEQATYFLSAIKQWREKYDGIIATLRTGGLTQGIKEIEHRQRLIDSIIRPTEEFLALEGIGVDSSPLIEDGSKINPMARRCKFVRNIINALPEGQKFDIDGIRSDVFTTYRGAFDGKKSFYTAYWKVVKELEEVGVIEVSDPGAGRRATIFIKKLIQNGKESQS